MRNFVAIAALALAGSACTDISSDSLLTSGMSAVITGETEGEGETEVTVVLRAGGMASNTFVELSGDDSLLATSGEASATLTKQSLGVVHNYVATLPVDAEDAEFTIALQRSLDEGAPASTFTLPAPFSIEDHADGFTDTTTLDLTWTPSGSDEEVEIIVDGECIAVWSEELSGDPGAFSIPGDEIVVLGDEPGATCPVDITVRKVRGGTLDAGYGEGGLVQARQIRTVTATFSQEP